MKIQFVAIVAIYALLNNQTALAQKHDSSFTTIKNEAQHKYALNPATSLSSRVTETPEDVLKKFHDAGMSPVEHQLTEAERAKVVVAFDMLPPLHRRILKDRLRSISFLDSMPNTALTGTINPDERYSVYHITIRAAILNETVSHWLTGKEKLCFDTTNSPLRVSVDGGSLNALVYVLIHETTHIVDGSLGISDHSGNKLFDSIAVGDFANGIWEDYVTVTPRFREPELQRILFRRGGGRLPVDSAEAVYKSLQKTPFVSLYGSCARSEDLAELVTVYHLTHQLKQPFKIMVRNNDKNIFEYEPVTSAIVRTRMDKMKYFYHIS